MYCQQDIELVQRLKEHDLAAYDIIYLKYYKLLCVNAYFFLKNEQESKDLVQNLFLDIWEKKLYLQFHEDLKGYLYRAIKNRCLNQLEKLQTQQKAKKGYAGLQEAEERQYAEIQPEYGQQLTTALENMPAQKKTAIQIVYLHGKRYQEAAADMGISINSLKTHIRTGLNFLRTEIKTRID
ncbi:sigma-70 family RNA polymerase sigma factor [Pseudoflavitalea sp. X16]|uniref:sigma-70 family RNA polymerase sigma factor n=1 Tax=Paraflavitalea devenefica TaxID=2716334 RepID=UPI00141E46CA|nr:sigma-70 family RNA polymerase sigma factor [Paraflavitalea devenefica]NII25942.1 sigma-70 family RNA polymerase sigma factor [Paraflavitalea devenefica]